MARHGKRLDNFATGHDGFDLKHLVFCLAVLRRHNPRTASGDEPTDGGAEVIRTGIVRQRQTRLIEFGLESRTVDSRLSGNDEAFLVDVHNAVHSREVDRDSSVGSKRSTLRARTSTSRNQRYFVVSSDAHNLGDVLCASRTHDEVRRGLLESLM